MRVTYVRVVDLPGGARCAYEIKGEEVTVRVAADAAPRETIEAVEEMWNDILLHLLPRTSLRLISGTG